MQNKYKSYNHKFIVIFLFFIISVIMLNIVTDPFNIFNMPKIKHFNYIKPDVERNQRVTKIVSFKLEKKPTDAVFLGSSRVNSSISEDYYKLITQGKIAKNLGMNALSHDETFNIARTVTKIHSDIQTIYVGLDFFRFLQKNKDNKRAVNLSDNPKLTISEFNPVILSFNTIIATFNTIAANIKHKDGNIKFDRTPVFINSIYSYITNYDNAVLAMGEIDKIKKFRDEMQKEKGFRVIFYTNPTHATDLALIDKMGFLPVYNQWKTSLAENFDFVDFNFINDITTEKIDENTKYFSELSHSTQEMGKIILDNLILNNNSYGIKTNKYNVRQNEFNNITALKRWENENPEWMDIIQTAIKKGKSGKNAV